MEIAPAGRRTSTLPLVGAAWSVVTTAIGLWWWQQPAQYPFPPDPGEPAGTVLDLVPPVAVPPALAGAGTVGPTGSGRS